MTPNPDALSEILSNQTFHQNHQNIEFSKMSFSTRRWWPNDVNKSNKKVSKLSCSEKLVFLEHSIISDRLNLSVCIEVSILRKVGRFGQMSISPWPSRSFTFSRWFCARTTFSLFFHTSIRTCSRTLLKVLWLNQYLYILHVHFCWWLEVLDDSNFRNHFVR